MTFLPTKRERDPEVTAAIVLGLCAVLASAIEVAPDLIEIALDERDRRAKRERKAARREKRR